MSRSQRRGLSECRDCALPIIFGTTPSGKSMPLNARPNPRGNVAAQLVAGRLHVRVLTKEEPALRGMEERYMPHAATCEERPRGQLRGQLRDQLRDQLRGQLRDQLRGQLRGQLRDQLRGQLWDQLGGQLDPWWEAWWLAYYTCALPLADLTSARLDALRTAQQHIGWWWPMQGAVVLTDRPTALHRDAQGNLHHDNGPAVTYADGWAAHFWHGISVPDDFWTWDTKRALAEKNAELRRCGIERIGWDQITDRLTLVGEADDPGNPGHTLRLYDLPRDLDLYDADARILICDNASLDKGGHRRVFGIPVPAHHTDPVAAAADLFGVPTAAYRQLAHAS